MFILLIHFIRVSSLACKYLCYVYTLRSRKCDTISLSSSRTLIYIIFSIKYEVIKYQMIIYKYITTRLPISLSNGKRWRPSIYTNIYTCGKVPLLNNLSLKRNIGVYSSQPPPRQPSGRELASSAGFNPPTRTESYQRRNKNGTSSFLVWYSTLKWKYRLFLKNQDGKTNVMDKIWDRKILQSRRSLAVVAGMEKPNDHAEPTKFKR